MHVAKQHSGWKGARLNVPLLWWVALLGGLCEHQRAEAQVCHAAAPGGAGGALSCKGALEVIVPFYDAAFWASSLVPKTCDEQSDKCPWDRAADAWRYTLNNLQLALESSGPAAYDATRSVKELQAFITQMGHTPALWYANWPSAVGIARGLLEQLRPFKLDGTLKNPAMALPPTNIGTRFPTFGRSVAVPTDGNKGASVTLANGFALPVLGFGVWQIPADGTTYKTVKWALELGYRHIDTAQGYGNEHEVGRAIKDSGVPRSQICLVTKLSNGAEYPNARSRFEQQLKTLGVEYIDVYMLHSPGRSKEDRQAAWAQLEELYAEGKIKALGVSNFNVALLEELRGFARLGGPVYIQNKYSVYHPGNPDEGRQTGSLMEWLARESIVMTGYSIIHPAHGGLLSPLEDPHVKAIAARHARTPSQVLHRWLLQLGAAVIPRSTKYERIRENGDLFSFMLPDTDMRLLNGIASLLTSSPGVLSPRWCEDVYGILGDR